MLKNDINWNNAPYKCSGLKRYVKTILFYEQHYFTKDNFSPEIQFS
jgi:hypothetical protein